MSSAVKTSATLPREFPWDSLFALVFIFLGAIGLRVVTDSDLWNQFWGNRQSTVAIGTVTRTHGAVRHRPSVSFVWHDLDARTNPVGDGDAVFTGDDGGAQLKIGKQDEVSILPNSLVIVRKEAEAGKKGISLEKGSVLLTLSPEAKPIDVNVRQETYQIVSTNGSGTVEVTYDPKEESGPIKISNRSGQQIEIKRGARNVPLQVAASHEVQVPNQGEAVVKPLAIEPVSPKAGAVYISPDSPINAGFRWKVADEMKSIKTIRIEISGASEKTVEALPSQTSAAATLNGGNYRWRLKAVTDDGKISSSEWLPFTVLHLAPPQLIGPAENAFIDPKHRVPLSWKTVNDPLIPEVEILGPKDSVQQFTGNPSGLGLELSAGKYQWRARVAHPGGQKSSWTSWLRFTVDSAQVRESALATALPIATPSSAPSVVPAVKPSTIPMPKPKPKAEPLPVISIRSMVTDTKLGDTGQLNRIPLALKWEAVPEAKSYRVDLFSRSGQKLTSQTVTTPSMTLNISSLKETNFTYQVTVGLKSGRSIASARLPIVIELAAPMPKLPPSGTAIALGSNVVLTWEKTVLTDQYRVQIATDPQFKKILVDQIEYSNLMAYKAIVGGTLYWRIQGATGSTLSQWSKPSQLIVNETH